MWQNAWFGGDESDGDHDEYGDGDDAKLAAASPPATSLARRPLVLPAPTASSATVTRGRSESSEPGAAVAAGAGAGRTQAVPSAASQFPTLDRLAAAGAARAAAASAAAAPVATTPGAAAAPATPTGLPAPVQTAPAGSAGFGTAGGGSGVPSISKPVVSPQTPLPDASVRSGQFGGGGLHLRQGQVAGISVRDPLSSHVSRFVGPVPMHVFVDDDKNPIADGAADDVVYAGRLRASVVPPRPPRYAAAAPAVSGAGGGGNGDQKRFVDALVAAPAPAAAGGGGAGGADAGSRWILEEVRVWIRIAGGTSTDPTSAQQNQHFALNGSGFRHSMLVLCPGHVAAALDMAQRELQIRTDQQLMTYVLGQTLVDGVWRSTDDLQRKRNVLLEHVTNYVRMVRAEASQARGALGQKIFTAAKFHSFRHSITHGCGCVLAKPVK